MRVSAFNLYDEIELFLKKKIAAWNLLLKVIGSHCHGSGFEALQNGVRTKHTHTHTNKDPSLQTLLITQVQIMRALILKQ